MKRLFVGTLAALAWATCTLPLSGAEGFLDRLSARPGDTVTVYFSGPAHGIEVYHSIDFGNQVLIAQSGTIPGQWQSVPTGSYASAPSSPSVELTGTISLEAWIQPTYHAGGFNGILTKYSNPGDTAYGIYLMPTRQLSFYLGETGVFSETNRLLTTNPISLWEWTHVVATYDGSTKRIYLNGELDVSQDRTGAIFDTDEPVRVASFGSAGLAGSFFDGVIDAPAIYDRALTPGEISKRYRQRGQHLTGSILPGCVARWSFDELRGTVLADDSGNDNALALVNNATRSVAGPEPGNPLPLSLLQGTNMPERTPNPAIRFASDDAFNPPWTPSWSFVVPPGSPSGFYGVAIRTASGIAGVLPLVVNPDPGAKAPIAVLANANTWAAYNRWGHGKSQPECLYTRHLDGTVVYYIGLRQPNPGGEMQVHTPGGGFTDLVGAERYLTAWLPQNGYAFDLYTDIDLHRDPHLLDDYEVFMIQGHSEYWTHEEVDRVEAFLNAGGDVVNLSGNTMWSIVSYNADYTIMEGRKHPWSITGLIPPSERWHSQRANVLGGTFRCVGRPEHAILGTGYGIIVWSPNFGFYAVLEPNHWVFAGTGLNLYDTFGDSGLNGGGILGHEMDVTDPQWSPPNIEILAIGAGFGGAATQLHITDCETRQTPGVQFGGEMTYYDHPGGGGVFSAPTVAYGGALPVDAAAAQVLRNVLDRFLAQ